MHIEDYKRVGDYERIVREYDPESGLKALIALHNTRRGLALGGCRMWPYKSEADALRDAKRLARGMTYKNALADLPFGGGNRLSSAIPIRRNPRSVCWPWEGSSNP